MKAIGQSKYGSSDVLEVVDVDTPTPEQGEVLLRVEAAAANPLDWHTMRGQPYLMRLMTGRRKPAIAIRGVDVAGRVEAVADDVTTFEPGDEAFGGCSRAFAEYVCTRADTLVSKPDDLPFEDAAAVPAAGTTALQAVRDHGEVQAGQRILINGASGGVGTFTVQIAKAFGAEVTGVCSSRNVDLVRSLGADHVVDYTEEEFTRTGRSYDVVIDNVGNRSLSDLRRVLTPRGTLVSVGAAEGVWIGPFVPPIKARLLAPIVSQRLRSFIARINHDDLVVLKDLIESGAVSPVVDRTYPLEATAEAIRYLERGHASGKVVLTA